MSRTEWKSSCLLAPLPAVLISCGTIEKPNAMTAAWVGIINSTPEKTYVSIRKERYSHEIIGNNGEFVINLTTAAMVKAVDYCGVRTGRNENKIEKTGLTVSESFKLSAPSIGEAPVSLECKVTDIVELGSHDMFLADIVSVSVDDYFIDESGKLRLEKAKLLAYAHGEYFELGNKIGRFGFSVMKKKTLKRINKNKK